MGLSKIFSRPVILTAVVLAGVAFAGLLVSQLSEGMCGNAVTDRVLSPDGQLEAVVFDRNCGATTGFSRHISIQRPGGEPKGGGSLMISNQAQWLHVLWTGPRTVLIRRDPGAYLFKAAPKDRGVAATYEPAPGPRLSERNPKRMP